MLIPIPPLELTWTKNRQFQTIMFKVHLSFRKGQVHITQQKLQRNIPKKSFFQFRGRSYKLGISYSIIPSTKKPCVVHLQSDEKRHLDLGGLVGLPGGFVSRFLVEISRCFFSSIKEMGGYTKHWPFPTKYSKQQVMEFDLWEGPRTFWGMAGACNHRSGRQIVAISYDFQYWIYAAFRTTPLLKYPQIPDQFSVEHVTLLRLYF